MICLHCNTPVSKSAKARQLCDRHYRRFQRYGDPLGKPQAYQLTQGFKGRGRIRCQACGEPCRDHSLTVPCAMADIR